jgi:hypothetical protein
LTTTYDLSIILKIGRENGLSGAWCLVQYFRGSFIRLNLLFVSYAQSGPLFLNERSIASHSSRTKLYTVFDWDRIGTEIWAVPQPMSSNAHSFSGHQSFAALCLPEMSYARSSAPMVRLHGSRSHIQFFNMLRQYVDDMISFTESGLCRESFFASVAMLAPSKGDFEVEG